MLRGKRHLKGIKNTHTAKNTYTVSHQDFNIDNQDIKTEKHDLLGS